jgi:hypothetical protein
VVFQFQVKVGGPLCTLATARAASYSVYESRLSTRAELDRSVQTGSYRVSLALAGCVSGGMTALADWQQAKAAGLLMFRGLINMRLEDTQPRVDTAIQCHVHWSLSRERSKRVPTQENISSHAQIRSLVNKK